MVVFRRQKMSKFFWVREVFTFPETALDKQTPQQHRVADLLNYCTAHMTKVSPRLSTRQVAGSNRSACKFYISLQS